eukprot:9506702-Heterocapsa_arctica.AAC.1
MFRPLLASPPPPPLLLVISMFLPIIIVLIIIEEYALFLVISLSLVLALLLSFPSDIMRLLLRCFCSSASTAPAE